MERGIPKLELRKPAYERLKLIRTFGRQGSSIQDIELRINLGRKKPNQEIQDIDSQSIGNNIKPLNIENTQHINCCNKKGPQPPLDRVRSGSIQVILKCSRKIVSPLGQRCYCRCRVAPNSFHKDLSPGKRNGIRLRKHDLKEQKQKHQSNGLWI